MAKKIFFTNFKGGTGVTTCCIGLAIALAESGERTLVVDGDTLSGACLTVCGLTEMQVYTLADYERGACRAKQTLLPYRNNPNMCLCPTTGLKDHSAAARAVNDLDGLFDYILLDKIAPECCDGAIIVTEPYLPSVKSADCCRSHLADGGIKEIGLIVNKLNGGQILNGETMTAHEIATVLHLELKAVIPEDLSLPSGKWKKSTFKAFRIAAAAITGKKAGYTNVLSGYGGVSGYFKRKLRDRV